MSGADAAEDAEDELHEEGRLDQPAVDEMREVVEVADVVAFVLERVPCASPSSFRMRSMSRKVLRKMKSSVPRRYGSSQSYFQVS